MKCLELLFFLLLTFVLKVNAEEELEKRNTHVCRGEKFNPHVFDTKGKPFIPRSKTQIPVEKRQSYGGIRISFNTDALKNKVTNSELNDLNDELDQTANWFSKRVEVKRVDGNLKLSRPCISVWDDGSCGQYLEPTCGNIDIPTSDLKDEELCGCAGGASSCSGADFSCSTIEGGNGISNTDLIIYVDKDDDLCGDSSIGEALASAGFCQLNEYDRPIAGQLNVCDALFESSPDAAVAVLVHELMHVLVFSPSLYALYRDEDGNPRTERDSNGNPLNYNQRGGYFEPDSTTVQYKLERGASVVEIVTENVLKKAGEHFDCNKITGVELENGGSTGSTGAHWESRILNDEVMSAAVGLELPAFTSISFALLQDSGWYKVDYGYSEEMNWGRNAGCDFVDDKCIDGNNVNSGAAFCDDINQSVISCTSSRMSKGTCYTAQYSSNLPEAYQYFDDPTLGGETLSDYCPSYELYLTGSGTSSCIESSNQPSDNENFLGEEFCEDCRCFDSTLIHNDFVCDDPLCDGYQSACYKKSCTNAGAVVITIDGKKVTCTKSDIGDQKSVNGFSGKITCPDPALYCQSTPSSSGSFEGTTLSGTPSNSKSDDNGSSFLDDDDDGNNQDDDDSGAGVKNNMVVVLSIIIMIISVLY